MYRKNTSYHPKKYIFRLSLYRRYTIMTPPQKLRFPARRKLSHKLASRLDKSSRRLYKIKGYDIARRWGE